MKMMILHIAMVGGCLAFAADSLCGQEATQSVAASTAIDAIREWDPQTPAELLRAVETLLNLRQGETAAEYVEKVVALSPDEPTMIALYGEFGPAFFIRLARESALGEKASPFARKVLETQHQFATNPERLRDLVAQVRSPEPEIRNAAVSGLRDAGSAAVAELLPDLAASAGTDSQTPLEWAMRQLGSNAIGPLMGALQAPVPELRGAAMRSLGQLNAEQAVPFLIGPSLDPNEKPAVRQAAGEALYHLLGETPDTTQALRYLDTTAQRWFREGLPRNLTGGGIGVDGLTTVWLWDNDVQAPTSRELPTAAATAHFAASLAADLYRLQPDNASCERLFVATQLAAGKLLGGIDTPLAESNRAVYGRLAELPVSQLEAVLDAELHHNEAAAMGAAELMGDVATAEVLWRNGGAARPLAKALRHADPRVRMAALAAIVKLDPSAPYPGAADFMEQSVFFASSEGQRRILVVHPRGIEAETLAGMARSWGFEADATGTARGALQRALKSPDYEAILISDAVERWTELLQLIRRDPRTGRIPVGLIVRNPALIRAEQLARKDPLTVAHPLPYDASTLGTALQRTLRQNSISRTSPQTRLAHGDQALGWLADLVAARRHYPFYEVLAHEGVFTAALNVPDLAARAVQALGEAGTPTAQAALVQAASQLAQPLELRQAAAKAFDTAVQRHGVQLTSSQILAQYTRYNASEKLDADTQQILGSLLNSIEAATPTNIGVQNK
jgi:HEAT repeat protein